MDFESVSAAMVIDTVLLLLIGVGPKLALVPFLKVTADTPQAVFPLAVPYLLNPAGIVVLITASAEAGSLGVFGVVIGALALVIALDVVVFRWANRISEHLNENRMLVTEKVFGFLLAALAVQLGLDGLSDLGVIHLTPH